MLEAGSMIARLFFSAVLYFLVLCNLIDTKTLKREDVLVLLVSLMLGTVHFFLNTEAIMMALLFVFTLGFAFYKTRAFASSLLLCTLSLTMIVSVQSVVATLYTQIANMSVTEVAYDDIAYWSIFAISSVIVYIISKLLGRLLQKLFASVIQMLDKKNERFILLSITILSALLIAIVYFVTFISTATTDIETLWVFNAFLLLTICVFVMIFCYGFFKQMFQSITIMHNQELLKNLQTYNIGIENLYTEMRHFRHDTINILSSAYKFIDNNDFNGWKTYFEKEVSPLYNNIVRQSDMFKQFENISSNPIKGFLMLKTLTAIDVGCNVTVGIDEQTDDIGVADIDMIRMLGILFDNAIDEGRKQIGIHIQLAIYKTSDTLTIHVSNEFHGEPPKIAIIFQNGYSTKGKGRGVGLYDLRRLVDNYDNVFLQPYIDENRFVQELSIEIQESKKVIK